MMNVLELPLEKYITVQPRILKRLHALSIKTVRDLLYHFPRRYEDYSNIRQIRDLQKGEMVTIQGKIKKITGRYAWGKRKMMIIEAVIEDDSGTITALWFNQYYLLKTLKVGTPLSISGKIAIGKKGLYLQHPEHEILQNSEITTLRHTGRLTPIYPQTLGLSSRWIRFLIEETFKKLPKDLPDVIPQWILEREHLIPLAHSLKILHYPNKEEMPKEAKLRFQFEELLLLQLKKLFTIRELQEKEAPAIDIPESDVQEIERSLPFTLTRAQKKCLEQVLTDLQKQSPMNRLLNGDVGSGKTIIAAIASILAIKNNFQVAFMAPTEILAKQHFETILKFFGKENLSIALLTSSEKKLISPLGNSEKVDIAPLILSGDVHLIIGTHSLIQKSIGFHNLGLVVVDEQHRFGVKQRAELLAKSNGKNKKIPHFLSMTATPIPRTLALTVYGDLEISVIDESPPGRQKIITKIVRPERRSAAYEFIDKELEKGRQVFVICPRIEEHTEERDTPHQQILSEEIKSVKKEFKKLSEEIFPHRKMKPREKETIMKNFRDGAINILIATSVIEVGIDVPNATIMMIEGAETFGLASLHQFRGRVGRGIYQSYCLLFPTTEMRGLSARLRAVAVSQNGFQLAEEDLKIRGPGNLAGLEQSGFHLPLQEALTNVLLVEKTADAAKKIFIDDPELKKNPLLYERLLKMDYILHAE